MTLLEFSPREYSDGRAARGADAGFSALVLVVCALLASCGDGKPEKGEIVAIPIAQAPVPLPVKSGIPLHIINGEFTGGLDEYVAKLAKDGFKVTRQNEHGFGFSAVTANKINYVDIPDYAVVRVSASKRGFENGGEIKQFVTAGFENGLLSYASWEIESLTRRSDTATIASSWIDGILVRYGLPKLKGEQMTAGLGVITKNTRKDDQGAACFRSDFSLSPDRECKDGIKVTYSTDYVMNNSSRDVCWDGVCRVTFGYEDGRIGTYRDQLRAALEKVYRQKFGDIDPPKQ